MSEHYFTQKPQSKSKPQTWNYKVGQKNYSFTTDEGVFSKTTVDYGSRLLIDQFEQPKISGEILDLGCGYGPIGIILATEHKDRHILMSDVNERAVMLAKQNAEQNNVTNVSILLSNRLDQLKDREFAAILINPPIRAGKKIVHQMFEESYQALKENGELWIVIQKKQGAPSAKKRLELLFNNVETMARKKGYHILRSVKR